MTLVWLEVLVYLDSTEIIYMHTSCTSGVATPWFVRTHGGPGEWSMQVHGENKVEVEVRSKLQPWLCLPFLVETS